MEIGYCMPIEQSRFLLPSFLQSCISWSQEIRNGTVRKKKEIVTDLKLGIEK